jgi:hypothetical protein
MKEPNQQITNLPSRYKSLLSPLLSEGLSRDVAERKALRLLLDSDLPETVKNLIAEKAKVLKPEDAINVAQVQLTSDYAAQ